MNKHTPGPWSIGQTTTERYPRKPIKGPNVEYICDVEIRAQNPASDNAALIAAAPELLEALKGCIKSLRALNIQLNPALDALVAKAEGR